jgi:uncharacterized protein DUF6941
MDPSGPHLSVATICDRVLTEQDGVLSAIRMVDRVTFLLGDDGAPVNPQHPVTILVVLRAGAARGTFNLEIRREDPSGEESVVLGAPIHLEGEERGASVVISTMFVPEHAGLYWYDVYFEGDRVTRMPLRAVFQPQMTTG